MSASTVVPYIQHYEPALPSNVHMTHKTRWTETRASISRSVTPIFFERSAQGPRPGRASWRNFARCVSRSTPLRGFRSRNPARHRTRNTRRRSNREFTLSHRPFQGASAKDTRERTYTPLPSKQTNRVKFLLYRHFLITNETEGFIGTLHIFHRLSDQ